MGKLLVVEFSDNDFGTSLRALGRVLIETMGTKEVTYMDKQGDLPEILTGMFRACLCLHQHRFDMYEDWGGKKKTLLAMERYLTSPYYDLGRKRITVTDEWDMSWDNGETLVVDFESRAVYIV